MADMYAVKKETLDNIAQAIRLKRDITDGISVDDMAMQIGLISGGTEFDSVEFDYELAEDITSTSTIALIDGIDSVSDLLAKYIIGDDGSLIFGNRIAVDVAVMNSISGNSFNSAKIIYNCFCSANNMIRRLPSSFAIANEDNTYTECGANYALNIAMEFNRKYKNNIKVVLNARCYGTTIPIIKAGTYHIKVKVLNVDNIRD